MNIKEAKIKVTFKEKQLIFSMLNKIALFGGLTAGEVDFLIPMLTTLSLKKGAFILNQGESPNNIFIIQSGEVKIIKKSKNIEMQLATFKDGDLFGETELIGIFKYTASAIATTDVELLVLSKSSLYSLHSKDIKLFSKIILNVARESCRRTARTDEYWLEKLIKLKQGN